MNCLFIVGVASAGSLFGSELTAIYAGKAALAMECERETVKCAIRHGAMGGAATGALSGAVIGNALIGHHVDEETEYKQQQQHRFIV